MVAAMLRRASDEDLPRVYFQPSGFPAASRRRRHARNHRVQAPVGCRLRRPRGARPHPGRLPVGMVSYTHLSNDPTCRPWGSGAFACYAAPLRSRSIGIGPSGGEGIGARTHVRDYLSLPKFVPLFDMRPIWAPTVY